MTVLFEVLKEKMLKETTEEEENNMAIPKELENIKIKVIRDRSIDDNEGRNGYRITLENKQGYKFSCRYNDSINNSQKGKKVNINDVIYCLLSDRLCYLSSRDYEDFCSQFGYEPYEEKNYYPYYGINAKANRAYRGCQRISENLEKLLTSESLEKLQEFYQDY